MCGIVGIIHPQFSESTLKESIAKMNRTLQHRGPDSNGIWCDSSCKIALGHTRLAIIDLTNEGHQPMISSAGRFTIVYNGEIYNFSELKKELLSLSVSFRGTSDTEVLLEGFEAWGIEATLKKCNGMFAFAVWDSLLSKLILGRDRVGVKPLYYGWINGGFYFASELKALRAVLSSTLSIDPNALTTFFQKGYITGEKSIYRGIFKLPSGTTLIGDSHQQFDPVPYWTLPGLSDNQSVIFNDLLEEEVTNGLEAVLTDAIKLRLISDVPLGAFLSGGIDSSLVVLLMQKHSLQKVKTFSIGFQDPAYNEAPYANAIAKHLGTEHSELYVSNEDILTTVEKLSTIYDEPFADPSQIPFVMLSEMTRQKVTVALSGDGGDELFYGYPRYRMAETFSQALPFLPSPVRTLFSSILNCIGEKNISRLSGICASAFRNSSLKALLQDNVFKVQHALNAKNKLDLYTNAQFHWQLTDLFTTDLLSALNKNSQEDRISDQLPFSKQMMLVDQMSYLQDDILVKVDRATMAVGLEAREPLLDYRLLEYAWNIPHQYNAGHPEPKYLLKKILNKYVPIELFLRPKMGFTPPLAEWLRGPLKEWAEALLTEKKLKAAGLKSVAIRQKWKEHKNGTRNWQYLLWDVLMYQAWVDTLKSSSN